MRSGLPQHEVLHQEFDVTNTTGTVFEVKPVVIAAVELLAHPLPHRNDIVAQLIAADPVTKCFVANALESLPDFLAAGHRACAQQGLMFPGPGVFFLVTFERVNTRNQQSGTAVGPQARIDFVQLAGARLRGQEVHKTAHQATEKHRIIERLVAVSLLLLAFRVVQENDIQVGAIREFKPAQFSIPDDAKAGFVENSVHHVVRYAMTPGKVGPGNLQSFFQDYLGKPGECIADFHNRQLVIEVRDRDAKHRRALKLRNHLHAGLAVRCNRVAGPALQFSI